jgi:hypothetical protein
MRRLTAIKKSIIHRAAICVCMVLFVLSAHAQGKFYATAPKSVPENQNFNLSYTD